MRDSTCIFTTTIYNYSIRTRAATFINAALLYWKLVVGPADWEVEAFIVVVFVGIGTAACFTSGRDVARSGFGSAGDLGGCVVVAAAGGGGLAFCDGRGDGKGKEGCEDEELWGGVNR